jgi:hypothetical protein
MLPHFELIAPLAPDRETGTGAQPTIEHGKDNDRAMDVPFMLLNER